MNFTRAIIAITLAFFGATAAWAQDAPKIINGGVINGKAVSLPKPRYPPEARAAGVGGSVKVQVTIDESGTIESAKALADDEECDKGETPSTSSRCAAVFALRTSQEAVGQPRESLCQEG